MIPNEVFGAVMYSRLKECELAVLGFFVLRHYGQQETAPLAITAYALATEVKFHRTNVEAALLSLVRTMHLTQSESGYSLGPMIPAIAVVARCAHYDAPSATIDAHRATSPPKSDALGASDSPKATRDARLIEPSHNRNTPAPVSIMEEKKNISSLSDADAKDEEFRDGVMADEIRKAMRKDGRFAPFTDDVVDVCLRYRKRGIHRDYIVPNVKAIIAGTTHPPRIGKHVLEALETHLNPPKVESPQATPEEPPRVIQYYQGLSPEDRALSEKNKKEFIEKRNAEKAAKAAQSSQTQANPHANAARG